MLIPLDGWAKASIAIRCGIALVLTKVISFPDTVGFGLLVRLLSAKQAFFARAWLI